jgi:cytochrome b subunit of formate dehydrogenase/5-methylcytosine-specific restriction endonuclease McrA
MSHRSHLAARRLGAALPGVFLALLLCPAFAQKPADSDCVSCHEQGAKVAASMHSTVGCTGCHAGHTAYPHSGKAPKPACAQCHESIAADYSRSVHGQQVKKGNAGAPECATCHGAAHEIASARAAGFRKNVPDTCGMCHSDISQEFKSSIHGQAVARGILQAPVCTDCHGEHAIQAPKNAASSVNASHIRATCGACHDNVRLTRKFGMPTDRAVSFDASFHGLAAKAGSQTVANCASCHGVHNILPSSDPKSTISAANLRATCGKCHQGAGTRFALGPVHLWEGRTEPASVAWARQTYLLLIPLCVGLMFAYNFGDWVRKLRKRLQTAAPAVAAPAPRGAFRMYRFERCLHAALAISFIVLAWTGFQLKYPDQWWARQIVALEGGVTARGVVHRAAAAVFVAAALAHLVSLFASRRLRLHWKNLWPRYTDVGEAISGFAYNFGLTSKPPKISPYSFVEKAEYWAVVWGGVIMTLSGVLLWANTWALKWFPKEVLDLATAVHFYEALLACLSILVWHFYVVIFDPDVYPMDIAWFGGYSVRRHEGSGHSEPEPVAAGRSRQ